MSKNKKMSICQNNRQSLLSRLHKYQRITYRLANISVKTPMVRKSLNHYQNKILELQTQVQEA